MKKTILTAAIAATLATTGCVALQGNQANAEAPVWAAHVSYIGKGLEVLDIRTWENHGKGTRVLATVTSNALLAVDFQYRFLWYTHDGQPIDTTLSNWNNRHILRGQTVELEAFSPGPRAGDYRLEIIQK